MVESDVLEDLKSDPYQVHMDIIQSRGYPALLNWVKSMAVDHKIRLMVLPTLDYEIRKWRVLASLLMGGLVLSDHDHPYDPQEPKGKFEMPFGFRKACTVLRNGMEFIRGGSLVRNDKLAFYDRKALLTILKAYNADMKKLSIKKGMGFMSLMDWMMAHPDALHIWQGVLTKRKGVYGR